MIYGTILFERSAIKTIGKQSEKKRFLHLPKCKNLFFEI